MKVPNLDFKEWIGSNGDKNFSYLNKVIHSFCTNGIIRIKNYSIPTAIFDQHFEEFNHFFELVEDREKEKYRVNTDTINYFYGYTKPFNKAYESFTMYKKHNDPNEDRIYKQLQISQYPNLIQRHTDIIPIISEMAFLFLKLLSNFYQWNKHTYAELTNNATRTLGFLKYFPRTMPFRHDGHRHNSFISIIVTKGDDDELEYQLSDGAWQLANDDHNHKEPYVIYILCGELLRVMTRGGVQACTHRLKVSNQSRESMLFFLTPADDYRLRVLPPFKAQNDNEFKSMNVKQWINKAVLSEIIQFNRMTSKLKEEEI